MRRRGWLAISLIAALLLGTAVAGLLYLRSQRARDHVRAYLETTLSRELAIPVQLGRVAFSLRAGLVDVRQAALLDPETRAPLVQAERLQVRLALWPLLRREVRVRSVTVRQPRLVLEDSSRLRALAYGLLARLVALGRAGEEARFPVSVDGGAVRYAHPGQGVAVDLEGLGVRFRWQTPDQATATLVGQARLRLGGRQVDGIRLEARAGVSRARWEVTRFQLSRGASELVLQGGVVTAAETPRAELGVRGTLVLDELAPLLGFGEEWKGPLTVSGTLHGDGLPPTFQGTLNLDAGTIRGVAVSQARASVSIRQGIVEVSSLKGAVAGGAVSASGSYDPGGALYQGRLMLDGVQLGQALRAVGRSAPLAGRVTGSVEGSGRGASVEALSLRADLAGRALRAGNGDRDAQVKLVGQVDGGVLKVERLTISRRGSQAAARGSVNLATAGLALRVSGSIDDVRHGLWPWALEEAAGRITFSGRLGRTLKSPAFSGRVRGQGLSLKAVPLNSVEGPLEVEPGRVVSRGLKVAVGRSTGVLAGEARLAPGGGSWQERLTLALKLDGRGRAEDLAAWLPLAGPLGGPFTFRATANGALKSLAGAGQVEAQELRLGAERIKSVRAVLGFDGPTLTIRSLTGSHRGVSFRVQGHVELSGRYRFTLAPVKLDLATLAGVPDLTGTAILSAKGTGDFARPQIEGELALSDTVFRDLTVGGGILGFALEGERWSWRLALDSGVQGRGTAPLTLTGPLEAEVSARDLDLSPYLRALRRRLPFPLAVRADGHATLIAQLPGFHDLRGRIQLTALRCWAGDTPCQLRAPAVVGVESGTLRFDALDLVGPGLSVTVNGSVQPGARTDLEFSGHAPFPVIESWVPVVSDVRGTPEVRVTLTGLPGALRVTGRAQLNGLEVQLRPLPVTLTVAAGEVNFENDRVQYVVSQGAAAAGRLEGRGASERRGERWHHAFEFRLDKAELQQLYDQLQISSRWAAGDFRVRASLSLETGPEMTPLKTLAGTLSASLEGGTLSRYPALVRIFGLLGSPAQPFRLPDLAKERMPYRAISADFKVDQGVMQTKNLLLDSEVVRVSGVGKVRIPEQTMDFNLAVRPLQVLEGGIRKIPLLGRLLPKEQGLAVVYFDVAGPWHDPKASVAPVKSLSQTVVDLLLFLLRAPDRLLLTPP